MLRHLDCQSMCYVVQGNRSPEPPYRANSRRLEDTSASEPPVKLSNRFNEVAAAAAASSAPAAPLSRPLLTTKTSNKFVYDSMQLPTSAATELDVSDHICAVCDVINATSQDEEFLADDSFQAPPPMKDLDELHGGSAAAARRGSGTVNDSGAAATSNQRSGARVVQVGVGNKKNNNRDLDTSNINDEFDF